MSARLYSTTSHRSRWDVTDAGDIFGAGRSWQIAGSLPLCRVTGLIITTLLPCRHIRSLLCLNPLLQHFSPTFPSPGLISPPLLTLSSTLPLIPSLIRSLSSSSLAPLLSTLYSSSACSAGLETSGSFSISVLNIASLSFQRFKKKKLQGGTWIFITEIESKLQLKHNTEGINFKTLHHKFAKTYHTSTWRHQIFGFTITRQVPQSFSLHDHRGVQTNSRVIGGWVRKQVLMRVFFSSPRWEAVQVLVGRLRVAIRPERRADEALPQTHRC